MKRRIKGIIERCEGTILDIGCVQHSLENIRSDSWLHGKLAEKFSNPTEIDTFKDKNLLGG